MSSILLHPALPKVRRYIYSILACIDRVFHRKNSIIIFAYHSIGNDNWRFGVALDDFCLQIRHLIGTGYIPVTLDDVIAHIRQGLSIPAKAFVVAFDDGYRDILLVKDFLNEQGIRPALFVLASPEQARRSELTTDRPLLSWEEIRNLKAAGWLIGCHSDTHADFSKIAAADLSSETLSAKRKIELNIGEPIKYFAYPKGYYNEAIHKAVREAGYRAAFSMDDGFIGRSSDLFALPRVGVDRTHTGDEFPYIYQPSAISFRRLVKSIVAMMHQLRGRF